MKLATITQAGRTKAALVASDGKSVWPLEDFLGRPVPDLTAIIAELDTIRPQLKPAGPGLPLSAIKVEAPIPRPARNIMCVGKNYHEHAKEFTRSGFDSSASSAADAIPTAPIIFTKVPECVIADGGNIRYPAGVSDSLDYEAELGLVIGRGGRGISKADAYNHVCGYTIINDVTARDLQGKHKQWFLAKSLDTFCPMGPWLVTADEVDPANLDVKCWVNDELRQNANTRDLIFDIPTLIATISAGITLKPGDVIATGTPAGVGIGFTPPKFLKRGDRVTIEIEGLGRLSNSVA
ncbi:MAG: fumarylacetoacetate hydrolase family protein [Reyranella sp.]|uniref:fumarylacetoacetate hydrolase family protein n=1 Tax=Bradyrhizobium sp. TaxID=376 RepID=UPI002731F73B|nr:fumarylacetoacetate hydrolase family protein [Bradyrhizobium sp.]MDP1868923.1 fumarylacetoacetate hydrolase family protein [Bradyrhizobium sp.]MDP3162335.1 fumarylacetoacetate hydrolase family protein [Reyranella sp.]